MQETTVSRVVSRCDTEVFPGVKQTGHDKEGF